jgi:tetratricopeptide (TPR) repeat protein
VNPNNASIISDLAGYYEGIGKFTHTQEMLNRALKLGSANLEDLFNITDTYEQMGDREQSLVWMDKLLENGYSLAKIRSNPAFKELRKDAQYKHMLKKYSLE